MVSPIKTALHDCSMTNMSSDVDPFALSVALPDQSGHLFGCSGHVGMASGCSRCLWLWGFYYWKVPWDFFCFLFLQYLCLSQVWTIGWILWNFTMVPELKRLEFMFLSQWFELAHVKISPSQDVRKPAAKVKKSCSCKRIDPTQMKEPIHSKKHITSCKDIAIQIP